LSIRAVAFGPAILCGLLTAFCGVAAAADNVAYMGTVSGDFGTIDLDTGVFTVLGNSGQTLAGMAVADGSLFASSYHTTGQLFQVNAANGSLALVGNTLGLTIDDFGSTTAGLFAVSTNADLYSINSTNGAASFIGATGLGFGSWRSLSTNSDTLYFANGANLYTLNTSTGAASLVGNMGGSQFGAMVQEGGKLYAGRDAGGSLAVATLNSTTGLATIGAALTGTNSAFYALAPNPIPITSAVPEPSTYALVLAGLGLLARTARRRRS
jgi:hypothetical protein